MLHKVNNGYVISSRNVWVPGLYADEATALYAFQFKDKELQQLQDEANANNGGTGGVITMQMLRSLRDRPS